jgi:hypothetical protein
MPLFAIKLGELQVAALVDPILQRIEVSREDIVVESDTREKQEFILPLENSSGDCEFLLRVSKDYTRAAPQRFSASLMRGKAVLYEGYARTPDDFVAVIGEALQQVNGTENVSQHPALDGARMPDGRNITRQ